MPNERRPGVAGGGVPLLSHFASRRRDADATRASFRGGGRRRSTSVTPMSHRCHTAVTPKCKTARQMDSGVMLAGPKGRAPLESGELDKA
eukprot:6482755-Pyramimonas_sp.AAC.1